MRIYTLKKATILIFSFDSLKLRTYNQIKTMNQEIEGELKQQTQHNIDSFIVGRRSKQFWYLKIMPIAIKNDSFIIVTNTTILAAILTISLYYGTIERIDRSSSIDPLSSYFFSLLNQEQISKFIVITSIIIQIYIIQNIILHHVKRLHKIPLLSSINNFIGGYLLIIIEINILLIYLSFLNQQLMDLKYICFVVANVIAIFSEYFLMPKNNTNDLLYTIETSFMVLFRCSMFSILTVSLVEFYHHSQLASVIVCSIISMFFGYKFHKQGSYIYHHQTTSICFNIVSSIFMAVSTTISLEIFMPIKILTPIILFLMFLLKNVSSSNAYQSFSIFTHQLTFQGLKAFIAVNKRLDGNISPQRKCLLIGQIQIHKKSCMNHNCFSKKLRISSKEQELNIDIKNISLQLDIETLVMYYTKCLFEELLRKNQKNVQILIFYSQYLLYEMKLVLPLSVPICELEEYKLNLSQQIRFQNLKDSIKEILTKQNQVNHPDFIIEEVTTLENIYTNLQKKVKQIVLRNIELWKSFKDFISLNQILRKNKEIFDIKEGIKESFINCKNFSRHPGLKKLVSFYQLYLSNDWKKQKIILALSSNITKNQEIKRKQYDEGFYETLITAEQCFSQNVIVILAKYSLKRTLIIQKTSKSITNILCYDQDELNSVDLNVILPYYLRQEHKRLMSSLIDEGFISNEKSLVAVRSQCLKKDQSLISVCKSFKTYANIYGEVEFACILKVDPIQPLLMICNLQTQILQKSSNFDNFIEQQCISQSFGLSNRYQDILQEIKNTISTNNAKFSDDFIYLTYQRKSVKFNVKLVQYKQQLPVLIVMIVIPFQSNNITAVSESFQESIVENVQEQFDKRQKFLANIFMKEQNYLPVENLPQIIQIKKFFSVFAIIYVLFPMIFSLIFVFNCESVSDYFDRQVFFIRFIKQPYNLGIFYYQIQMQLYDEIEQTNHHIRQYHDYFLQHLLSPTFLKIIFDKSLFTETFLAVENYFTENVLSSFQVKDVIFNLGSFISSYKDSNNRLTKQQFNHFNGIMMALNQEFQNVKNRLFQQFTQTSNSMMILDIILISIIVVASLLTLLGIWSNFTKLSKTWNKLLKLLSNAQNQFYSKTVAYWKTLKVLLPTQKQIWSMKTISYLRKLTQKKESVVRHYRIQQASSKRQQYHLLYFGIIIIVMMLLVFCVIQYLKFMEMKNVKQFYNKGTLINNYPSSIILSYCLLQRHYNQTVLKIVDQKQDTCQNILRKFKEQQKIEYITLSNSQKSSFDILAKEYLFGTNPCFHIPMQAQKEGFTYQKCSRQAEGHLSSGIIAFERYSFEKIQNIMKNSSIFQKEELKHFIQSLSFSNSLIEQMLTVWSAEYHDKLNSLVKDKIILNSIVIIALSIIYYYIIFRKIMAKIVVLQIQYKQAYSMLMIKDRIQNDKIAQNQLILCGFLQKK